MQENLSTLITGYNTLSLVRYFVVTSRVLNRTVAVGCGSIMDHGWKQVPDVRVERYVKLLQTAKVQVQRKTLEHLKVRAYKKCWATDQSRNRESCSIELNTHER